MLLQFKNQVYASLCSLGFPRSKNSWLRQKYFRLTTSVQNSQKWQVARLNDEIKQCKVIIARQLAMHLIHDSPVDLEWPIFSAGMFIIGVFSIGFLGEVPNFSKCRRSSCTPCSFFIIGDMPFLKTVSMQDLCIALNWTHFEVAYFIKNTPEIPKEFNIQK